MEDKQRLARRDASNRENQEDVTNELLTRSATGIIALTIWPWMTDMPPCRQVLKISKQRNF
ncbi:MAG: hypothetical protein DRQ63_06940 [Gammaproteobacteria bacterium]|nr:MAG: hypothetical protein DRQ63_06940 [Gammaproteobacteria bacterium]